MRLKNLEIAVVSRAKQVPLFQCFSGFLRMIFAKLKLAEVFSGVINVNVTGKVASPFPHISIPT